MRSVSKRQKAHDPEAVCSVTSFTARPLLRVGGKDKGTRFLSFVDAMLGFRHLLTNEDLNKASSLCTSMKGTLKSKSTVFKCPLLPYGIANGSSSLASRKSRAFPLYLEACEPIHCISNLVVVVTMNSCNSSGLICVFLH